MLRGNRTELGLSRKESQMKDYVYRAEVSCPNKIWILSRSRR